MRRWPAIGLVALAGCGHAAAPAEQAPVNTGQVEEGRLSAVVSQSGILTYRARPDGSPFVAINQAQGTYTELPSVGDEVGCGHALYRVDDKPVLLLCGTVPAYRALRVGRAGPDVRQLNRTLHVGGRVFTARTAQALVALQRRAGARADGTLGRGEAVFLPGAMRIAKVTGELGATARPGTPVLKATSRTLHVQVNLDPSEQGRVKRGNRAQITLPGNRIARGRVDGFGRVAQAPASQDDGAGAATIPTSIALRHPRQARRLDRAPVQVDVTTAGVRRALSVPATALVGTAGGGFAVEVVGAGAKRDLVPVRLGLFDTAAGRIQVTGGLRAGDRVVVPSL